MNECAFEDMDSFTLTVYRVSLKYRYKLGGEVEYTTSNHFVYKRRVAIHLFRQIPELIPTGSLTFQQSCIALREMNDITKGNGRI